MNPKPHILTGLTGALSQRTAATYTSITGINQLKTQKGTRIELLLPEGA